ncbi:MAG: hypothetical protein KAI66_13055 [Lentisphaeria bacterium]|nr:hypothetical protein [Lentisphaeria bacterium]
MRLRAPRTLSLLLVLFAAPLASRFCEANGNPVAIPAWQHVAYCRKAEGNLVFRASYNPGRGFELLLAQRVGEERASLRWNRDGCSVTRANEEGTLCGTRVVDPDILSTPSDLVEVTVKFRESEWLVYHNNRLVVTCAAPLAFPADAHWPDGETPPKMRFRSVPREQFRSDFMIEEGAPNQLYPWRPESGQWRVHTALDDAMTRPESNIARIKQVPLTADKSPNFYCLKGGGENAVIVTGRDFYDDYEFSAAVQANEGEAGLIFYHRDAKNHYGFTFRLDGAQDGTGVLHLWRVRDGVRTSLARARAHLFRDQWYMPSVRVHTDEIICLLDNSEVLRVSESLPVGGKVGLFANVKKEIRFDDVSLDSYERISLNTVDAMRYRTLHHEGNFYGDGSLLRKKAPGRATVLTLDDETRRQRLVFGCSHHKGVVMGASFSGLGETAEFGVIAGFRSPSHPYYRFEIRREGLREIYTVHRMRRERPHLLETWEHKLDSLEDTVRVGVDASQHGRLRFLRNERLVSMLFIDGEVTGGAGLYVGEATSCRIGEIRYGFHRRRFHEQPNKNPVFQHDSFMRHWSSPEGQWVAGQGGHLWHKGDFFGDFVIKLPCVAKSTLRVGVSDEAPEGAGITVAVQDDGKLTLTVEELGSAPQQYACALPTPAQGTASSLDYELHREGYWIWVEIDGVCLIRHRFPDRLSGTRAWIEGLTLVHLARSRVTRTNVIDDFFTASPHNWMINGGKWQIINRFQCTPSWSHMVGESKDTMAALWHKYIYTGDLTVEFYAGVRHGWYARAGDLNVTTMAATTSPSSGYTVTCTEWDYNLSQNWSTLSRKGKVIERSDKYLVPRVRKGMVRKYLNPLVSKGRPIHGAWYYIKLRKVGDRIEYFFDNELIFSYEDKDVLHEGLVGIWTFMQSMTLAQVKITFEEACPRPVEVLPLPAEEPEKEEEEPPPALVTVEGQPFDSLASDFWKLSDPVAHSQLRHVRDHASATGVVNRLGSGNMLMTPVFDAALPLHRVAGWRFLVKRTPTALFNLHYSLGRVVEDGKYVPVKHCFHQLSGTGFGEGGYVCTGRTTVPGSPSLAPEDWSRGWHQVEAWIPSQLRSATDESSGLLVRLEGFGNMQPNDIMCGVKGNQSGDGYMIRQLTPVFYGRPHLAFTSETPLRLTLRHSLLGPRRYVGNSERELLKALVDMTETGLNTAWLRVEHGGGRGISRELAWIKLPERPQISAAWDSSEDGVLRLEPTCNYPDPRLFSATVECEGKKLPLDTGEGEIRTARLPRSAAADPSAAILLTVNDGVAAREVTLNPAARPVNDRPVLLALEGIKTFVGNFENGAPSRLSMSSDGRLRVVDDPTQGRCLLVRNTAPSQRLSSSFTTDFSIAENPLFLFRYQASDMTHLTMAFKNYHYVRLGDDYAPAAKVRFAHDLEMDKSWHTWLGFVSDAFTREPLSLARFTPGGFTLGSSGSPDQTGRFSSWHVDDLVFGPAIREASQLTVTPTFYDRDGVAKVWSCLSVGETPYSDLDEASCEKLAWRLHSNGTPMEPVLEKTPDGVHHFLFRAADTRGVESSVTDIPFLLDRLPLEPSVAFGRYSNPSSNGTQFTVSCQNHGAAPWAIGKTAFLVGKTPVKLSQWTNLFRHSTGVDKLTLNYPFILRSYLDKGKDGDVFDFVVSNIVDGAGNGVTPVKIPVKIDYASDKVGPAWYSLRMGSSVHWFWNWDGYRSKQNAFTTGSYQAVAAIHRVGQSGYLRQLTYRSNGDLSRSVAWAPSKHPWLSFRLRRPNYRRRTTLHVYLTTTSKKTYTLSLGKPRAAGAELNRTRTIAWTANKWQSFNFNVRDLLLASGVAAKTVNAMTIQTISFVRRGAKNQTPLHLDDFFVHGAPTSKSGDTMTWTAYDASGVAGLEMTAFSAGNKQIWQQFETSPSIHLAPLRAKVKGCCWVQCRARDKAGKLSVPFWLPLAGK